MKWLFNVNHSTAEHNLMAILFPNIAILIYYVIIIKIFFLCIFNEYRQ